MYMYYLLGYKYFGDLENMEKHYNGSRYEINSAKKKVILLVSETYSKI